MRERDTHGCSILLINGSSYNMLQRAEVEIRMAACLAEL